MTPDQAITWFNNTTELNKFKKHADTKAHVKQVTSFLPDAASLPQRLWHIINSTDVVPKCPTCSTAVSWDHRYKKYKTFCGNAKCYVGLPEAIENRVEAARLPEAIEKRRKTNLERYGATNYLASDEGKTAAVSGKIRKYGDDYMQQAQKKRDATCVERYGHKNPRKNPDVKDKIRRSHEERYGCHAKRRHLTAESVAALNCPDLLFEKHNSDKKSLTEIADELGVNTTTLSKMFKKHNQSVQRFPVSTGEKAISAWLTSVGITHDTNVRDAIPNQELDIVIPSASLAIEYCGLYWHSDHKGRGRQYHARKMKACSTNGLRLLTIFEDEWAHKADLVKSKILSLLNLESAPKVSARQCVVETISSHTKTEFFSQHHIQGSGPGSINYGLKHGDELVAVMSFIVQRGGVYVLNRYATSKRVQGGFTKLLSFFKCNHQWTQIVSFADLRWSCGDLYANNGWTLDKTIPPDYFYSTTGHDRIHKFNFRHSKLKKLLEGYDPTLSETVNCRNHGLLRIWDCGKLRYVLNNTQ